MRNPPKNGTHETDSHLQYPTAQLVSFTEYIYFNVEMKINGRKPTTEITASQAAKFYAILL